jgi:transglutaminase superfamily protein
MSAPEPLPVATKLALGFEVARAYVRARRSLRRSGLRGAVADLRTAGGTTARAVPDAVPTGFRLGRAVARTLAVLPGDTRCLAQSLVLTHMLARRGIDSRLVIGVRPGERFAAHAWVEHDGVALLPAGRDDFQEIVTL